MDVCVCYVYTSIFITAAFTGKLWHYEKYLK